MTAGGLLAWVGAIALSVVMVAIALVFIVGAIRSMRRPRDYRARAERILRSSRPDTRD